MEKQCSAVVHVANRVLGMSEILSTPGVLLSNMGSPLQQGY